jgi:hypothetical protein
MQNIGGNLFQGGVARRFPGRGKSSQSSSVAEVGAAQTGRLGGSWSR